MRNRVLMTVVVALALSLGLAGMQRARGDDGLEPVMKRMDRALKTLKKIARDPAQQADANKAVQQFEADVVTAKGMLPPGLPKADADRDAAIASYRAMMMNVLRAAIDLEEAIGDKKADDVAKALASIDEIEKQGHKEFRKDD